MWKSRINRLSSNTPNSSTSSVERKTSKAEKLELNAFQRNSCTRRIVVLGNSGVGKTSLVKMFTTLQFEPSHLPTIGIDFGVRTIPVLVGPKFDKINTKLQLWDCAGQEKFRSITRSYYRDTQGILLMFDPCNRYSFTSLDYWLEDIQSQISDKCVIWVLGNKQDLYSKFVAENKTSHCTQQKIESIVSPKEIQDWITKKGLHYRPCCVKTNLTDHNIDVLFYDFALELNNVFTQVKELEKHSVQTENFHLAAKSDNPTSKSCCS